MNAAQYTAPGQIEWIETDLPAHDDNEVLLRTRYTAICGSDLHLLNDSPAADFPFLPGQSGHECVGVVESAPDASIKPGQRMLVLPPGTNAFAEYLAVKPAFLIPIPDNLDDERAILAQQLGTVIYCCKKLDNVLDKTAVIIGQGPAGLLFTALLKHMGIKTLIALDIVAHRLGMAKEMGADHVINPDEEDPVEKVKAITHGHMADVVVEVVGKAETINQCAPLAAIGGEVALFGVPKSEMIVFNYAEFFRRNLVLKPSVHAQSEPGLTSFRLAIDMISDGRIDVSNMITHHLPPAMITEAFHLAQTKADGAVKVLLDFG